MASGYVFGAQCPSCGGRLAHVTNHGDHIARGAIADCEDCGQAWHVHVTIARVPRDPERAAYKRRLRAKETSR